MRAPIRTFPECRPYVPPRVRARRTRRRVTLACAAAVAVLAAGMATVRDYRAHQGAAVYEVVR